MELEAMSMLASACADPDQGAATDAAHAPPAELLSQARLPLESEERSRIEYLLQMSLQKQTRRARIKDIVAISNPHLSLRFQQRTEKLVTLESWVDVSKLDASNPVSHVISNGFEINEKGLVFTNGEITLPRKSSVAGESRSSPHNHSSRKSSVHSSSEGNTKSTDYQMIFCQVGVGRSYCMKSSEVQAKMMKGEPLQIPDKYDSIYIHDGVLNPKNEEANVDERSHGVGASEGIPKHRFLIKDADLVLPSYLVSIEIDSADGIGPDEVCDSCKKEKAVVYCVPDRASLCEKCDRTVHSTNSLLGRHTRVPIAEKPLNEFGRCMYHKFNVVEFYCHLCQVPVCIHCKMIGSHSAGHAAMHKLTPIREAYELAIMASRKNDPFLAERKAHIESDLGSLRSKLNKVNENADEAEQEIRRKMEQAIRDLAECTEKKVSCILSEELDLRRQLVRIRWLEEFLSQQQRSLGPVEFLEAWGRHVKFRTELHTPDPNSGIRRSVGVAADVHVRGELNVYSASSEVDSQGNLSRALSAVNDVFPDDEETLQNEVALRSAILKDLDTRVTMRSDSPASVASLHSLAQRSIADSNAGGIAAPGGRSLKDLSSTFEPSSRQSSRVPGRLRHHGTPSKMEHTSFSNVRSPDDIIADRMRTPSRARVSVSKITRQPSPANSENSADTSTSHISTSRGWADVWNTPKPTTASISSRHSHSHTQNSTQATAVVI